MSVGDSALDYFNESHIKKNIIGIILIISFKRVQNDNMPFFNTYDLQYDFQITKQKTQNI